MRIRQHVNPLKSDFFEIPLERLHFPAGVPVEVELGSAEAVFLMDRAVADPNHQYVGVEIRRDVAAASNVECQRRGLDNVRSVFANLSVDLPRLFARGSVHRFHLNFPDPWFKSRQHKRRVMSSSLVQDLHGLLTADGEVHVASDIFEIALDAMAQLEAHDSGFVATTQSWSFLRASPFAARSRRERQCEGDGTHIWRLAYRRQV